MASSPCGGFLEKAKPYFAMICLQFGYAGMNVITKVSLNHGMSHYVLVVYRHAFATISIAPFALLLERKVRPKMTWSVFLQIFVLALLGPVIDQNFYYAGLKFTGPTFACAMSNILPAMTFVMAVIFRMEKVDLKKVRCQAKVAGTLVTVAGAMMMTLYKGPLIQMAWTSHVQAPHGDGAEAPAAAAVDPSGREWFLGSLFVVIATLAWASLFILQAHTLKKYSAPLSLTTLICFVGTLQAIVVTFAMEHRPSVWAIGFDMNLLAAAYAGIVTSSIAYYVQGLVIQKTGPVFASAFSPLMMIIVAGMGSFILAEKIYLGGVLGAVLIVVGLYSVLWGKHKETQEQDAAMMELPVASKGNDAEFTAATIVGEDDDDDDDEADCKKANGVKLSSSNEQGASAV
uniref:WAT1-related protein n=1 Tax=Oryza meridionalis TaxID=40149 RepID=A0A0E0C956_9ORYZ